MEPFRKDSAALTDATELPVTAITRLKPKAGLKEGEIRWFHGLTVAASRFNGYVGAEFFEVIDTGTHPEFAIIIHFDTYANLLNWEKSAARTEQMKIGEPLFDEVQPKLRSTGLEYWFETTAKPSPAPPKWKMLLITVAVIYTLFSTLIPLLGEVFIRVGLPTGLHSLFGLVLMVTLMTYLIMPIVTKVLSGWLAPNQLKDHDGL